MVNLKAPVLRHFASSTTQANHSVSQLCYQPYRAHRTNGAQLVKLAPELLAVNLPPAVGLVSQSASRGSLRGTSTSSTAFRLPEVVVVQHNLFSQLSKVGRSRRF
ncbi:hypothetical protein FF1_037000 [Malus domestica]